MSAWLELKRADVSPKCATCRQWAGRETSKSGAFCEQHKTVTLDLSVCSAWELHEVLHGQIMEPEGQE